jgi:nucleoside-diphosphate-sugar epimerase
MAKVLVTGSEGEVGNFVRTVEGWDCDCYDIKFGDDIWDTEKLISRMKGKDIVVHLAAYAHPFMEGLTDDDYFKLNFEGTKHVVSCMKKAKVKKLIFMSSGGVYGFSTGRPYVKYLPLDEKHPRTPDADLTNYDKTKLACEEFLLKQKGIKSYILRLEAPGTEHVYEGHLFARITGDNFRNLLKILGDYKGKSDVFNAGDAFVNSSCPNTLEFAKSKYPDAKIRMEVNEPLISIKKAQDVLGYKGDLQ